MNLLYSEKHQAETRTNQNMAMIKGYCGITQSYLAESRNDQKLVIIHKKDMALTICEQRKTIVLNLNSY